jgi:hypothetical protein
LRSLAGALEKVYLIKGVSLIIKGLWQKNIHGCGRTFVKGISLKTRRAVGPLATVFVLKQGGAVGPLSKVFA